MPLRLLFKDKLHRKGASPRRNNEGDGRWWTRIVSNARWSSKDSRESADGRVAAQQKPRLTLGCESRPIPFSSWIDRGNRAVRNRSGFPRSQCLGG
jgi:hypothetical protein